MISALSAVLYATFLFVCVLLVVAAHVQWVKAQDERVLDRVVQLWQADVDRVARVYEESYEATQAWLAENAPDHVRLAFSRLGSLAHHQHSIILLLMKDLEAARGRTTDEQKGP